MKKIILLSGVAALMTFAASCNQNQAAAPAQTASQDSVAVAGSIVFFNMDKVMEGYDMANDLNSVFETKTNGIQAEIDRRGSKLEYQKLQQQQQEYQEYVVRKQQEMAEEQQVMMNQIANAIAEFVEQYNVEHEYALILATGGSILSTPVVVGSASLDITEDLLSGLNAEYIKTKETSKK